jgi:hypothetical protein
MEQRSISLQKFRSSKSFKECYPWKTLQVTRFWGKGTVVLSIYFVIMGMMLIQIHLVLNFFSLNAREQWPKKIYCSWDDGVWIWLVQWPWVNQHLN